MAEKKSEFEQAIDDFNKAYKAENWDEAIEAGKRVKSHLANAPEGFNAEIFTNDLATAYGNRGRAYNHKGEYDRAIDDFSKVIEIDPDDAEAYYNRGLAYAHKGEYDRAIADFNKAIELNPNDVAAYHNRALAIGRQAAKETEERLIQEAKETEERLKQSHEEQLASISDPAKINKIFEEEIETSKNRLGKLRVEGKNIGENLWWKLVAVWGICFGVFALLKTLNLLPIDTIFLQLLSFSFSVIFISSPFIWRLRRVNHDIRVERHALEDFRRKHIMLLLRVAQGDTAMRNQQTADIVQHFDKRGTPEVLNHLYHPRHAHPSPADDDSRLKQMEAMLKSLTKGSK